MFSRVEEMLGKLEEHPDPAVRETVRDLVRAILEFHRAGLERLVEISENQVGISGDPRIEPLLLLHGLHPEAINVRVERALEKVRPFLFSHGGSVELLGVDRGRVRLRLLGSCNGCPSSAQTLRTSIEEAVLASAPDAEGIEVV